MLNYQNDTNMRSLIQNQTVSFDTHQAGDGQKVKVEDLHMHKRMNGRKYKGVNIKIPFNPEKEIEYTGNNSDYSDQIINEIKRAFKKNPNKVREFAKDLANRISRYSSDMNAENSRKFLEESAQTIAKHFELNEKIINVMISEIYNHVSFFITSHKDDTGKTFYIKQDIDRKRVKIGDDLEKIFYGNGTDK